MTYIYTQNELAHYGILGQKWGIRRFQNPDGTLTEAGKKRYGTVENLEAGRTKRQAEKYAKKKAEAVNSGRAENVQKFSKELTPEEAKKALERIKFDQDLAKLRQDEIVLGQKKLQNIIDVGGKIKAAGETVTSIYNITAAAYNAFSPDGNKWPIIDQKKEKISESDLSIKFNREREQERWKWEQEEHAKKAAEKYKESPEFREASRAAWEGRTYKTKKGS